MAPERLLVQKERMSEYQLKLQNKSDEVENLVPNLRDKVKYVVHHRNLKLNMSLGIKL